jgi:CheY-like chemotaxis protein
VPRTILYIEDNLASIDLIKGVLAHEPGVTLLSAMQGSRGLDLARAHHPDLILLDVHLPDMPGDEVLDRLRADAASRRIPVVVISADATHRQAERLTAAGARAYLTKPIDIRQLRGLLASLGPARGGRGPAAVMTGATQ